MAPKVKLLKALEAVAPPTWPFKLTPPLLDRLKGSAPFAPELIVELNTIVLVVFKLLPATRVAP